MHAAPPVRMTLTPDRAWQAFVAGCAALAAANLAGWAALRAEWATPAVAGTALLAAGLAAGAVGWRRLRDPGGGTLAWDGAVWQWAPGSAQPGPGDVRVLIDLGAWILLRFVPAVPHTAAVWLALSSRQARLQWPQWRSALRARRPGGDPGAAASQPS